MRLTPFICIVLISQLAGCSNDAIYEKPVIPYADKFKEMSHWVEATPSTDLIKHDWWKLFNDQVLDQLESKLDDINPNLGIYLARLEQSRAYTLSVGAKRLPSATAFGQLSDNRQSDNRPLRSANQPSAYGANSIGISIDYDLDLWGRVKDLVKSGKSLEKSSELDYVNARTGLQTELAFNYFELRKFDEQITLYQATIKSYENQLKLTRSLHDEGVVSGLDVSRALAQLETIKGIISVSEANRAKSEHAIAVLVDQSPSIFSIKPRMVNELTHPDVPVSIPSVLLQRRPDIASIENKLAAANANIGVAKTAFFPDVSLGLAAGFQNTGSINLLTAPNIFFALGPTAIISVFDGGLRDSNVKMAVSKRDETAAEYKLIILKAFKEVEDDLSLLDSLNKQMANAITARSTTSHSFDLVMNQYFEGIVSYFEVVKANDDLLNANELRLNIKIQNLEARVSLIRSLGGGWITE